MWNIFVTMVWPKYQPNLYGLNLTDPSSQNPTSSSNLNKTYKLALIYIDFAELLGSNRPHVLWTIADACETYGFFQVGSQNPKINCMKWYLGFLLNKQAMVRNGKVVDHGIDGGRCEQAHDRKCVRYSLSVVIRLM